MCAVEDGTVAVAAASYRSVSGNPVRFKALIRICRILLTKMTFCVPDNKNCCLELNSRTRFRVVSLVLCSNVITCNRFALALAMQFGEASAREFQSIRNSFDYKKEIYNFLSRFEIDLLFNMRGSILILGFQKSINKILNFICVELSSLRRTTCNFNTELSQTK